MKDIPDSILIALSTAIFVGSSVWGLAWWLSGKFSKIESLVYAKLSDMEDNILEKLEYHEKHDDTRFEDLNKELWDVKIRMASKNIRIKDLEGRLSGKD